MTFRTCLAKRLRYAADRLDDDGAPKRTGWSFTHEGRDGMRFREDGRGAPLWYVERDYDRAHNEADTPHLRVNWTDVTVSYPGGRGDEPTAEPVGYMVVHRGGLAPGDQVLAAKWPPAGDRPDWQQVVVTADDRSGS